MGQLLERNAGEDAGVAHHCVEPAEPVDGSAYDCRAAFRAVDGVMRCHRGATGALDLVDDLVGDPGIRTVTVHAAAQIVYHYCGTAPREFDCVEAAKASPPAGDDNNLAGEVDHWLLLADRRTSCAPTCSRYRSGPPRKECQPSRRLR